MVGNIEISNPHYLIKFYVIFSWVHFSNQNVFVSFEFIRNFFKYTNIWEAIAAPRGMK